FEQMERIAVPGQPRAGGEPETLEVNITTSPKSFRLRAVHASGNRSAVSTLVSAGSPYDTPDPPYGLLLTGQTSSELHLRWIATGDDGWVGRPARYEIAASPLLMTSVEFERAPFRYARD